MQRGIAVVVTAFLLLSTGQAFAIERQVVKGTCGNTEITLPPITVGCEAVDCCPGCPLPDKLDWRIRVLGQGVTSVRLGGPALSAAKRLGAKGGQVGRLPVRATIRPVVQVKPMATGPTTVVFEQLLGSRVVNATRAILVDDPQLCGPPDFIALPGKEIRDPAVDRSFVMVDGRDATGCVDDRVASGMDGVEVDNLLPPESCRSEVFVFSRHNGLSWATNVTDTWTPARGDRLEVPLRPRAVVPLTVWKTAPNLHSWAEDQMAMARAVMVANATGIEFDVRWRDISADTPENDALRRTIGTHCPEPGDDRLTRHTEAFEKDRLNIYVIGAYEPLQSWCPFHPLIFAGPTPDSTDLARKLAVAFSLTAVTVHDGFTEDNLMALNEDDSA
ncbi:MAG TPA: hypothetical protein VLL76_05450, partial [Candidatus Omnitrophota bacterium]|nr:hypothetical protein [Candidatus Omnitrophota bacterium]